MAAALVTDFVVRWRGLVLSALVVVLGAGLGLGFPPSSSQYPQPWATVSGIVGWTYFAAWSISFWPQVFINIRRKSVVGLSLDYLALNILGFTAYTTYNLAYYYNTKIRGEYVEVYGSLPGVQSNDVFFAVHAVCLTVIVGSQAVLYERGGQSVSLLARCLIALGVTFIVVYGSVAAAYDGHVPAGDKKSWLNFLVALSYVKLAISISKYIPQVFLNYKRKSTEGWSVENVMLDFTGGSLSVLQEVGDAASINDWSIISGDPVKFGLGFISMLFDLIFMVQHFGLYRQHRAGRGGEEKEGKGKYAPLPSAEESA